VDSRARKIVPLSGPCARTFHALARCGLGSENGIEGRHLQPDQPKHGGKVYAKANENLLATQQRTPDVQDMPLRFGPYLFPFPDATPYLHQPPARKACST
jgi:hypothetical protein